MLPRKSGRYRGTWGLRIPATVGALIALTLATSIAGTVCEHIGIPLMQKSVLLAGDVRHGEVWRLLTWVFCENHPINLVFTCLWLYWLGRDLSQRWGEWRFLLIYLGLAVVVGGLVVLTGSLVSSRVFATEYLGSWPVSCALMILWAFEFSERQMNFFVAQLGGRQLVWVTIGGTVLFSIYYGPALFAPHFFAEALALIGISDLRRRFLRWRLQRQHAKARSYLRSVARTDEEEDRRGPPSGERPKWLN